MMQQKLSELGLSEETTRKQLQELRSWFPIAACKQALDAVAELDKMLNTAQVEIAGMQATLKAIQDHMKTHFARQCSQLKSKLEVDVHGGIDLIAGGRGTETHGHRSFANRPNDLHGSHGGLALALPRRRVNSRRTTWPKSSVKLATGCKGELPALLLPEEPTDHRQRRSLIYPVKT